MQTPGADHVPDGADVARQLGRGLAVIRVLLGVTFLSNGLAKLFEFDRVHVGWYVANLIDRADARFILPARCGGARPGHSQCLRPRGAAYGNGIDYIYTMLEWDRARRR